MARFDEVAQILAHVTGKKAEKIQPTTKMDHLGSDSLERTEIALIVSENFGIDISDDQAQGWETVADVVLAVECGLARKAAA